MNQQNEHQETIIPDYEAVYSQIVTENFSKSQIAIIRLQAENHVLRLTVEKQQQEIKDLTPDKE